MRAVAVAVTVIASVLVASGCASSGKKPTRSARKTALGPAGLGTPATRIDYVRVARASNRRFFIFPALPGKRHCAIPYGAFGTKAIPGNCQTSVHRRQTEEPSVAVTFTEKWLAPPCMAGYCPPPSQTRHHSWRIIEGETIVEAGAKPHVYATRESGSTAPQDYR